MEVDPRTPLLYVLRNDLGLNGPKFGCGQNQCGACMAIIDGQAKTTCTLPVAEAQEHEIRTLESLGTIDHLHPVQKAFIAEQAAQCGYCLNGLVMSATALLEHIPNPSEEQIREGLSGVLCRCGVHARAIRAVQRAAKETVKP